jgi:hypothetical protein
MPVNREQFGDKRFDGIATSILSVRSVRRNRLHFDERVLAPKRKAGMGRSQIGTLVVLEARLLSCDGAVRNWGLAPDAANPSFAWFRNDLNV